MERIINRRLGRYLESQKLLTNVHCGFKSKRSRMDHPVRFETFCGEAVIHNQHYVCVLLLLLFYLFVVGFVVVILFIYLENASDKTWTYGIVKNLDGFGIRGYLSTYFFFKIDLHLQEKAIPQCRIRLLTLFCLKINSSISN